MSRDPRPPNPPPDGSHRPDTVARTLAIGALAALPLAAVVATGQAGWGVVLALSSVLVGFVAAIVWTSR